MKIDLCNKSVRIGESFNSKYTVNNEGSDQKIFVFQIPSCGKEKGERSTYHEADRRDRVCSSRCRSTTPYMRRGSTRVVLLCCIRLLVSVFVVEDEGGQEYEDEGE